ncbi:uncharacterized protein LOC143857822 [Tasmannia lanceolata]|uniref:uncharacterized protein LOC143857822 n=1 Tax=Tasmannia lanceolata TaxID=3420 RepID=UPI0040637660
MDIYKGSWILEFLLRQPIEDWVLNRLVSILPSKKSDILLKKTILLRRICSSILKRSITEKILDSLESIEEIDREIGIRASDSIKAAYCAVAVDFTVGFLRENRFDRVNKIWKIRVSDLEKSEGFGLVSDWLRDSKMEMEAAVENERIRNNLLEKDTRKDAMDCVWVFLEEEVKKMGPTFLEFTAERVCSKEEEAHRLDAGNVEVDVGSVITLGDGVADMELDAHREMDKETMQKPLQTDARKGSLQPIDKDVPIQDISSNEEREITMVKEVGSSDTVNLGNCGVGNKYHLLSTPSVNKVREDLKSSFINLQAVVEDPLPDSLKMAERILSDMPIGNINQEGPEVNHNLVDVDVHNDEGVEGTHVGEPSTTANQNDRKDETSCPGFIVRNGTDHTCEWDEDFSESLSKNSPTRSRKIHLPSPKNNAASPLKKQDSKRYRRKIKRWSLEEEEALRDAVQKHGVGRWAFILDRYPDKFDERTPIDLKDKWRNMIH